MSHGAGAGNLEVKTHSNPGGITPPDFSSTIRELKSGPLDHSGTPAQD